MEKQTYKSLHRYCSVCGKEVGILGIERFGHNRGYLCYDCDQKFKAENYTPRSKEKMKEMHRNREGAKVSYLHRKGLKPTEIANALGITTKQVYERLNER